MLCWAIGTRYPKIWPALKRLDLFFELRALLSIADVLPIIQSTTLNKLKKSKRSSVDQEAQLMMEYKLIIGIPC